MAKYRFDDLKIYLNWLFGEGGGNKVLVIEIVATIIIIVTASVYLVQVIGIKATTSLENDEIYTIMNFSSRGVLKVLTDYHAPNNHIFFNLLNAVTPIGFRFGPWQSRIWSMLSISVSLLLILYFFFRRKLYIEGALLFQLVAVNYHLMDNSLKARGYGLLVFFAFVSSLVVIRYLETFQLQLLLALSAFTILGAWTVPNYIFFGGFLLLLLFVWTRRRAVFITGILTLVITIGVYLPVLQQLLGQMNSYASEWGREFANNEAIIRTLYLYVLNPSVIWIKLEQDWIFYTFLFTLLILPALIWEAKNTIKQSVYLILTAVILLFTVSRIMETPTIRTISFVAMPIFLVIVLTFSQIIRRNQFRMIHPFLFGGIAFFSCCTTSVRLEISHLFRQKIGLMRHNMLCKRFRIICLYMLL